MFASAQIDYGNRERFYAELTSEMKAMAESTWFTNLANASALLMHNLPDLNWAGFYVAKGEELILGPFQGLPACLRIPFGKGVCGTAARDYKIMLIEEVEAFPGHIACDARSRSELVMPLVGEDRRLLGVLDLDSPNLARFDERDVAGLLPFVRVLVESSKWPQQFG